MPRFRVELERHVSRVVELRQTAAILVDAPNLKAAHDAAWDLACGDDLYKYMDEWKDDDSSRQASNDEETQRPYISHTSRFTGPSLGNVLNAMPEPESTETPE